MIEGFPKLPDGVRLKRIERLLDELKYEIHLGIVQGDLSQNMSYRFMVPSDQPNRLWDGVFSIMLVPYATAFGEPSGNRGVLKVGVGGNS